MLTGKPLPLVVLDADGVFMNEMTYWRTALAAAFTLAGFDVSSAAVWQRLDRACLQDARLQRITKSRNCNSNWDLAAVMSAALSVPETCVAVRRQLNAGADDELAATLAEGMERLWRGPTPGAPPISGFGIDRQGRQFDIVRQRFQDILYLRRDIGWAFPRHELLPPAERTRSALVRLHSAGLPSSVCTSRPRHEIEQPIRDFGLADCFDLAGMATDDEVRSAQQATGCSPLGKPHWFPLACAVLGYAQAVAAVTNDAPRLVTNSSARVVYVGDASADFDTARGAHARGLPVVYVHIDSGVSLPATLDSIRQSEITASLVPDLSAAADLILERLA